MAIGALLLVSGTFPQWWPGGDHAIEVGDYPLHLQVINDVGGGEWYRDNLRKAMGEWNDCGARVVLELNRDLPAFTPLTITVFVDEPGGQEPAYGGWNGTAGIVAVGEGPEWTWARSQPVLAHELGHALGFGHASHTVGANSVMGGANHIQPTDCEGLRRYYGSRA